MSATMRLGLVLARSSGSTEDLVAAYLVALEKSGVRMRPEGIPVAESTQPGTEPNEHPEVERFPRALAWRQNPVAACGTAVSTVGPGYAVLIEARIEGPGRSSPSWAMLELAQAPADIGSGLHAILALGINTAERHDQEHGTFLNRIIDLSFLPLFDAGIARFGYGGVDARSLEPEEAGRALLFEIPDVFPFNIYPLELAARFDLRQLAGRMVGGRPLRQTLQGTVAWLCHVDPGMDTAAPPDRLRALGLVDEGH